MFINPVSCNYNTSFQAKGVKAKGVKADGDVIYRNGKKYVRKALANVDGPIFKLTRDDIKKRSTYQEQIANIELQCLDIEKKYRNATTEWAKEYYYSKLLKLGYDIAEQRQNIDNITVQRRKKILAREERNRQKMMQG